MKRAVVAIYIDPDFYPPTINAILNLAEKMDEVIVISRNNSVTDYPYPSNVKLKKTGKFMSVRDSEKLPVWSKIYYFLQFTFSLLQHAKNQSTRLVLLYDPFALFAFYLVKHVRDGKKIWYHNHDMPNKTMIVRYSIGAFAAKYEDNAMRYIHFFSLPSKERMDFYPRVDPAIPVFILPNYPSLKVYRELPQKGAVANKITIIYQGFIGKGHALEEMIELLQENINGLQLNLVLKGSVTNEYKAFLRGLANRWKVEGQLTWHGIGPYSELPPLTASCDIGIGINMNTDAVSQTQGTASNKIYEYAATGLPVILYDTEQFTRYLGKYRWASFTDGSVDSIRKNIERITENLAALGRSARQDFKTSLNFEHYFIPALNKVLDS